jgi:hypothetical protein
MLKNRMSKRSIGALIAGMLLGVQVGVAAASESDFPLGAEELSQRAEPPARDTYRAEHPDGQAAARNNSFPGGPSEEPWQLLPGAAAYFDRKAAPAAASSPTVPGNSAD